MEDYLNISLSKMKKFYKQLNIIDIQFNINTKDYKSIYSRDHVYTIIFNKIHYKLKSKAAVDKFTIQVNFDYTLLILELNSIYTDIFNYYRSNSYDLERIKKEGIASLLSNIEYQFKYFNVNRYKANYAYYVVVQINKITDSLIDILAAIENKNDLKTLYLLQYRIDNLQKNLNKSIEA